LLGQGHHDDARPSEGRTGFLSLPMVLTLTIVFAIVAISNGGKRGVSDLPGAYGFTCGRHFAAPSFIINVYLLEVELEVNEVINILIIVVNRCDMSSDGDILVVAGGRSQSIPKINGCRAPGPQVCITRRTYLKPGIHVRSRSVRISQYNEDLVPVLVVPITHNLALMIIELGMVSAFPILGELLIISVWCAALCQNDTASECKKHRHTGSHHPMCLHEFASDLCLPRITTD
jgi:hypothetical protein